MDDLVLGSEDMDMLACEKKVVATAVFVAVFVCASTASAATISYTPDEYLVFAGNNLELGGHSQIWGRAGAGADALIYGSAIIVDDATSGDLLADDDVAIQDDAWITGRVLADNADFNDDPVLNGLLIGDYATVVGRVDAGGDTNKGSIQVGNYADSGSVYAPGTADILTYAEVRDNINAKYVNLGANSHTYGNINYGVGYTADPTAVVDGTVTKGGVTSPDDYTFSLRSEPAFETGGTVDQNITSDQSLDPGIYRDLTIQAGVTLSLSAGTYDFQNITMANAAEISADTSGGDVVIRAFSDLTTTGNNILYRNGQGEVLVQIGDEITIGANSTIDAHLLAYSYDVNGETSIVTIGNDCSIYGRVYSEDDVVIGERVVIPEPGTLMLLGLGAACMLLGQRRRHGRA